MKLLLTTSLCLILCNLTGCAPDPSPTTITASTTPFPVITATSTSLPTGTQTITLTPTPTVTPTITPTPTPDAQAVIANIVNEFNLNPQRQYEIMTSDGKLYLIDTFNHAKMAKMEGNLWADTTTEEKYGHLVPEGEKLRLSKHYLDAIFEGPDPSQGIYQKDIQTFDLRSFIAWSTGNMYYLREYNNDLDQEVINIYGTVVFPDHDGNFMEMNTRYEVVDPGYPAHVRTCTWLGDLDTTYISKEKYCSAGNSLPGLDTVEDVLDFHIKPGQPIDVAYVTERPDEPPVVWKQPWYSNINNRAGHYTWHEDKEFYRKFTEFLIDGGEISLPKDFIFSASGVAIFMTREEVHSYFGK